MKLLWRKENAYHVQCLIQDAKCVKIEEYALSAFQMLFISTFQPLSAKSAVFQ